ncbi:MAG: hypothetical protein IT158_07780 [Bryobacterales bacterium]|nr:hypothetical protein [Bryobacterales bacterium]
MVDSRAALKRRLLRSLLAVLLGNLVYYSLWHWLPPAARHEPFQLDVGLAVDAWVCLVFYGLLGHMRRFRP